MSNPKFQIGEEVILVSKIDPSLNGEYVVEDVQETSSLTFFCKWGQGYHKSADEPYHYKLLNLSYMQSGVVCYAIKESSLKKKHKPADDDFQEWLRSVINTEKNGSVLTTLKVRNKKNKTMMGEME